MTLLDRVHDVGRVITSMGNKVDFFCKEGQRLKEGGDPEAVAVAEGQLSEAQTLVENLQAKLDEAIRRWESIEKGFGKTREELADLRRQLANSQEKLVESRGRPLARLQARHPRLEIEEDPFVLLLKDVGVPMADEQSFNDSLPPLEE
ncbi:hypothetical protein B296_00045308 [Ensete ventricosum]|uniref:Uncharacterized protein n=1 Tax=Ensete ventricosum TaxID=4639 RepID=A0A426YSF6_ENSVE|nr:hypothetical protein B296_00045308 [Ensete ventricosum]